MKHRFSTCTSNSSLINSFYKPIPFVDGRTTISHTKQHPADTENISTLNDINPGKILPFYTKVSSKERMGNLYLSNLDYYYSSFQRTSPTSIRN